MTRAPDDRERLVWEEYVRGVKPLSGVCRQPARPHSRPATAPPPPSRVLKLERCDGMRNVRRGRLKPDEELDLHGQTRDDAERELVTFVRRAHARGHRLLLVITGKGRQEEGVLRAALPGMVERNLVDVVSGCAQAHWRHGGRGAYYLFLRASGRGREGG